MRLLFLLLPSAHSITSTFSSAFSPNILARDDGMTSDQPELHKSFTHETIEKTSTFSKRLIQLYNALAVKGSDVNETEAFLRTKVSEPDKILQYNRPGEEVTGWWWLLLDAAALDEVKAHKGIVDVEVMKNMEDYGSLPPADASSSSGLKRHVLADEHTLTQRAEDQEKQEEIVDNTDVTDPLATDHASATENQPSPGPEHIDLGRRDAQVFSCLAKAGTNATKTEDFLKNQIKQGSKYYHFTRDGKIIGWWDLVLDDTARKAVENYKDIRFFKEGGKKLKDFRALPARNQPSSVIYDAPGKTALSRRSGTWIKQQNSDRALVMDSQYSAASLSDLTDFVYKPDPGQGVFVYIIDQGVRVAAVNKNHESEFHPPDDEPTKIQIIQSQKSKDAGLSQYEDHSSDGTHGTGMAARALGTLYGLAKKATLISVKVVNDPNDIPGAFELVKADLAVHEDRKPKSVVVIAKGWNEDGANTYDLLKKKDDLQVYGDSLRDLLKLGVPVVCAAGNDAQIRGSEDIDHLPALFQDEDTPIINVGAAGYDGKRASFSQGGSQLTIYAPGIDLEIPTSTDFNFKIVSGTSGSAPQVAGLIATYMAYDQKPWDDSKQGIDRVKAIRDYLLTDRSNWARAAGIRMIWNGAGKEDHESANTPNNLAPFQVPAPDPFPTTPGPAKGKALSIILQSHQIMRPNDKNTQYQNNWLFFPTDRGKLNLCRSDSEALSKPKIEGSTKALVDNPPSLPGSQDLKIDGTDCTYMNNGKGNAGKLWCGANGFDCFSETEGKKDCSEGSDTILWQRPIVHCEWSD